MCRIYVLTLLLLVFAGLKSVHAQVSLYGKEFFYVDVPGTEWDTTFAAENYGLIFSIIAKEKPTKGRIIVHPEVGKPDTLPFSISNIKNPYTVSVSDKKIKIMSVSFSGTVARDNRRVMNRHITIEADEDISVLAIKDLFASSEAMQLYPLQTYGKDYVVIAPDGKKDKNPANLSLSQCVIIAKENNTKVLINSPVPLIKELDQSFEILLQKGQCYLLQGAVTKNDTVRDISGTVVTADNPISIFSGANCYNIGVLPIKPPRTFYTCNKLFEQLLPCKEYAKEYLIVAPSSSLTDIVDAGPHYCKVMPVLDTASLFINNVFIKKLQKGEPYLFPIELPSAIRGTSPLTSITIRRSGVETQGLSSDKVFGDPFMVLNQPMNLWTDSYSFVHPENKYRGTPGGSTNFTEFYATIVIPKSTTVYLDDKKVLPSLFKNFDPISTRGLCSEFAYATLKMTEGVHTITADKRFGIYVYAYGQHYDAYGYTPAGINTKPESILKTSFKDTVICPGASVRLSAQGGDNTYVWSPKEGLSCTDCPNPIATPIKNTTYTVTSNNPFGCPVLKDTVRIIIQPALVDAGKDVGICSGDSIRLSVNEGKIYLWSPAEGLSCTDCREPFAKPSKNQRYYVTLTDKNGCIGTDSVLVSVGKPTADAGKDTTICLGTSVRMRASGGNTYRWSPSPDLSCTDCPDPIITPKQSTTYTVTSYLSANCFATDSVRITVEKAKAEITTDKTILCPMDSVTLSAKGGIKVQWNGEGIRCTDCAETKISPMQSGYYTLTVTTATGCTAKDSVYITVNKPSVKVSPDTVICKGNKAYLRAEGGIKYSWSPLTGLSCTDCAKPEATPLQTTRYTVTSYDNNNCMAQASVLITVDSCPIIVRADTVTLTSSLNCAYSTDKQSYTHNSDKPLQLREPELISGDGLAFRVTYNVPTNSTLNNNNELIVTTELLSTSSTPKQVLYRLGTSSERELHLKATGEYISKTASLKPTDTIGVIPGEGYVPIHLVSDGDIEQIRELRTVLSFPSRFMNYVPNKHSIRSISGWNFGIETTSENNGMTYLTLYGKGNTPLLKNTPITSIETDMYLGDSVQFTIMTEQSEVPKACYTIPQGRGIVGLGGCFAGGRAINTGLPYSVQAKTENNTLILDYTAGLDGITECTLLNTLGEHIAEITYRTDSKGEYRITYPMEALSSGNYIVLFRSGIFRQSILINLVR